MKQFIFTLFAVILIASALNAEIPGKQTKTITTKGSTNRLSDSLIIVGPGTTTATVIDTKNQFFITNGVPDKYGRIYVRFNGGVRSMAPAARMSFTDENKVRKYFVFKGIENGKFVFYIQSTVTTQAWNGISVPVSAPDTFSSMKNFIVSPGITTATIIDSRNQFFITKGVPDKYGRIYVRFNGGERSMAPGARIPFTDQNNVRRYFIYKGIENGKFVFYIQDYEIKKIWTGTTPPVTADGSSSQKNFAISPGTTSAAIIDKQNQFFISNGTDQNGRIRVRFNGGERSMAPGARLSFTNENNTRKYFVYKGFEEGKFVFYTQNYE